MKLNKNYKCELITKTLENLKFKGRSDRTLLNYKCWLLLSFCCGLRVSEVATIKIENINSKEHSLKIIGKGNKERITILPDLVIKILRIFYKSKNLTKKSGYLFEGTNNNPHTNFGTIINYFTSLKNKYNLDEHYTFHSLRHSFATYFLMNGGNQKFNYSFFYPYRSKLYNL